MLAALLIRVHCSQRKNENIFEKRINRSFGSNCRDYQNHQDLKIKPLKFGNHFLAPHKINLRMNICMDYNAIIFYFFFKFFVQQMVFIHVAQLMLT